MSLSKLIEAVEAGKSKSAVMYSAIGIGGGAEPATIGGLPADQWQNVLGALDGSLDAAKRLHDALLPGWEWLVRSRGDYACVYEPEELGDKDAEAIIIGRPARAWLLAILRALEHEGR